MAWSCKEATFLVLLLLIGYAAQADAGFLRKVLRQHLSGVDVDVQPHWALLVAGSMGWANYRHQSNVCHAYQVLKKQGLDDEHIVVMIYDDIASNPNNPYPGKIFNEPGGPDVYEGVVVDYTGSLVTVETFLAVLRGDREAVKGKGTEAVIDSGPEDNVFVYYADHGGPGVLGMPKTDGLYSDQLVDALKQKYAANGFKELVMYVEACESGSMFDGWDAPGNINVYAITAANSFESSWGTYCPGTANPPPDEFDTCLGDLFSVSWLQNSEDSDLTVETLKEQYEIVRNLTSDGGTYTQGSHVTQYGKLHIQSEPAINFMGSANSTLSVPMTSLQAAQHISSHTKSSVPARDVDLWLLRHRIEKTTDPVAKAALQAELEARVTERERADQAASLSASHLLSTTGPSELLFDWLNFDYPQGLLTTSSTGVTSRQLSADAVAPLAGILVSSSLGRPSRQLPLVDDWGCLRAMVGSWEVVCGRLDEYAMKHTRYFANLCNAGVQPEDFKVALASSGACARPSMTVAT